MSREESKVAKKEAKPSKQTKTSRPPRKSRIKETFSELKKVSWPSFAKTMKHTGMVLSVVLIFGLLVFGLDSLVSFIIKLITSI